MTTQHFPETHPTTLNHELGYPVSYRYRDTCRMHAVVSTVRVENLEVAREALAGRVSVVPRAPGFVSAYWLAPVDGIGLSVIVFDTKEHAEEAARYPVPPLPTVTLLTVEVREVYASA
jgi:hypothetical protein